MISLVELLKSPQARLEILDFASLETDSQLRILDCALFAQIYPVHLRLHHQVHLLTLQVHGHQLFPYFCITNLCYFVVAVIAMVVVVVVVVVVVGFFLVVRLASTLKTLCVPWDLYHFIMQIKEP